MTEDDALRLFEFTDLIHGIARQLRPPADLEPGVCTPIEITVMRFIDRNPGTSARTASEAALLPTSNFSRVIRGLEAKGLVRREPDPLDARVVRLYPTSLAEENFRRLRDAWSRSLEGIIDDPTVIDSTNAILRRIETELITRKHRSGAIRLMVEVLPRAGG